MPTLASDGNSDSSSATEERSVTDSDISFIEVRNVMHTIDLVNAFKTSFFDHWKSATWALLSWLE
jgi:hypothetical protein